MSVTNHTYKFVRSLAMRKYGLQHRCFVAEGPKAVRDLLPLMPCRMLFAEEPFTDEAQRLMQAGAQVDELCLVSHAELERLSSLPAPRGAVAVFHLPEAEDDGVVPSEWTQLPARELCLALDGVQDPGNVGTIVRIADWRVTFWVLAVVGVVCLVLAILFKETLPKDARYQGSVLGSLCNLVVVAKNKGFTSFLLIIGMFSLPFMAYIAVASYIYIDFFGLDEMGYSVYFAIAALLTAVGPFIWLVAQKFMNARRFTSIILSIAGLSGVAMLCVGQLSPTLFSR